jgi:hypothetical protein
MQSAFRLNYVPHLVVRRPLLAPSLGWCDRDAGSRCGPAMDKVQQHVHRYVSTGMS